MHACEVEPISRCAEGRPELTNPATNRGSRTPDVQYPLVVSFEKAPNTNKSIWALRACLRRYQASQAAHHEVDHGHADHGFAGLSYILIIFG